MLRRIFRRGSIATVEPPVTVIDNLNNARSRMGLAPMPLNVAFAIAVEDRTPLATPPVTTTGLIDIVEAMEAAANLPAFTRLSRERDRKRSAWKKRGTVKDLMTKAKKANVEQITDPLDPRLATFWMLAERAANDLQFCPYYDLFVDRIGGPNRNKRE